MVSDSAQVRESKKLLVMSYTCAPIYENADNTRLVAALDKYLNSSTWLRDFFCHINGEQALDQASLDKLLDLFAQDSKVVNRCSRKPKAAEIIGRLSEAYSHDNRHLCRSDALPADRFYLEAFIFQMCNYAYSYAVNAEDPNVRDQVLELPTLLWNSTSIFPTNVFDAFNIYTIIHFPFVFGLFRVRQSRKLPIRLMKGRDLFQIAINTSRIFWLFQMSVPNSKKLPFCTLQFAERIRGLAIGVLDRVCPFLLANMKQFSMDDTSSVSINVELACATILGMLTSLRESDKAKEVRAVFTGLVSRLQPIINACVNTRNPFMSENVARMFAEFKAS